MFESKGQEDCRDTRYARLTMKYSSVPRVASKRNHLYWNPLTTFVYLSSFPWTSSEDVAPKSMASAVMIDQRDDDTRRVVVTSDSTTSDGLSSCLTTKLFSNNQMAHA